MTGDEPPLAPYRALFGRFGGTAILDSCSLEGEQEVMELFEQAVTLMARDLPCNRALPRILRHSARKYLRDDPLAREHFAKLDHRRFLLQDLHEWLQRQES